MCDCFDCAVVEQCANGQRVDRDFACACRWSSSALRCVRHPRPQRVSNGLAVTRAQATDPSLRRAASTLLFFGRACVCVCRPNRSIPRGVALAPGGLRAVWDRCTPRVATPRTPRAGPQAPPLSPPSQKKTTHSTKQMRAERRFAGERIVAFARCPCSSNPGARVPEAPGTARQRVNVSCCLMLGGASEAKHIVVAMCYLRFRTFRQDSTRKCWFVCDVVVQMM